MNPHQGLSVSFARPLHPFNALTPLHIGMLFVGLLTQQPSELECSSRVSEVAALEWLREIRKSNQTPRDLAAYLAARSAAPEAGDAPSDFEARDEPRDDGAPGDLWHSATPGVGVGAKLKKLSCSAGLGFLPSGSPPWTTGVSDSASSASCFASHAPAPPFGVFDDDFRTPFGDRPCSGSFSCSEPEGDDDACGEPAASLGVVISKFTLRALVSWASFGRRHTIAATRMA